MQPQNSLLVLLAQHLSVCSYASVRMHSEGIRLSVGVSVFLSFCLSVILSVTGIAAQRVQFKC